jgi:hypothetical protein
LKAVPKADIQAGISDVREAMKKRTNPDPTGPFSDRVFEKALANLKEAGGKWRAAVRLLEIQSVESVQSD